MSFTSVAALLETAQREEKPLAAVILEADCRENGYTEEYSRRRMAEIWAAMQDSSRQYRASDRSHSGLSGGDGERLRQAAAAGRLLGGSYFLRVTEEALREIARETLKSFDDFFAGRPLENEVRA